MKREINVIPKPNLLTFKRGSVHFGGGAGVFCAPEHEKTFEYLKKSFPDMRFRRSSGGKIRFVYDISCGPEGYRIIASGEKVEILASAAAGSFYAIQTLRQLSGAGITGKSFSAIPCCTVSDEPRFKWRGFMLDEARHFFGAEKVKQTLDMMAMLKLNVFHWHLSDDQGFRVEIKKYPLLAERGSVRNSTQLVYRGEGGKDGEFTGVSYGEGCYYTQEQLKEIVAYAAERHINILPEIDMPGHLVSAISCYPSLSCKGESTDVSVFWGVMDNIGCCGRSEIYDFACTVIDELAEVFPFPYFHIGGDEVPKARWKECPHCQAKMKELGLADEDSLQGYFNSVIQKHLAEKGRHLVGWTEVLDASEISDDAVIQWWIDGMGKVGDWIRRGNKVILSKVDYLYLDHFYCMRPLSKTYSFDLCHLNITPELEKNVLGIEAPLWTEYVRDNDKYDLNTYPRMQALAEINWSAAADRDYADFRRRLAFHEGWMDSAGIRRAFSEIYEPADCEAVVNGQNFWTAFTADSYLELKLNEKLR